MRIKNWKRQQSLGKSLLVVSMLMATACSAANSITAQPVVTATTYSSARITWTTSEASSTIIHWGVSGPPYRNLTTARAAPGRAHAWFLSGLNAETTYHFAVCSATPSGDETCSGDQTFTTTEKGDTDAIAPNVEVDVALPESTGNELFVGDDCDDPTSGLLARWTQATWGDTVVIPTATRCVGNYAFPAKAADTADPHRWIITRSAGANDLPPSGSRIDPATDAGKLARVATNRPSLLSTNTAGLPVACEAGSYAWVSDDTRVFKLQQCRPGATMPITAGTGNGVPIVVTVPNHGITGSPYVRVQGVTGNTNANGTFLAVVRSPSTIQLNYVGYRPWNGNGSFSGGTLTKNSWQAVNFTTATTLPAACAAGEWFLLIGAGTPVDRTYRCLEANAWTRFSLRGSADLRDGAAIDLEANAAHHLRFIGLEVTSIRVPDEPLWRQMTIDPLRGQPGSVFFSLINQSDKNSYIIWDRCWVHGQSDRSRQWLGFVLDGAHVAVVDSVVDDMFLWSGIEPGSLTSEAESSAFFIAKGPGPLKIENNYVEAGGISLYIPSDRCCSALAEPSDAIVRRNTFHVGDEWRFGAPTFAGRKIVIRHLLELKQGRRWKIDGNIFDGTFTSVNQAAAIVLSPRSDGGYFLISNISGGVATMNPLFGYCPTDTRVDDWVTIYGTSNNAHHTGWRVEAVNDGGCTLKLDGITGTSSGGNLQIMTNRRSITDIAIQNNTFKNVANGIAIIGHTDGSGAAAMQLETARRISIVNNLFQSIDGTRSNSSDTSGYPEGIGGYPLYVALGMEDLHFIHNTVVMSTPGPGFAIEYDNACVPTRTCNPHAGLIYENNIVHYGSGTGLGAINASGTAFGIDALNALWRAGDRPDWVYRKNVIATRSPLPTQSPFGPYPGTNRVHDLNNGDLPFVNPSIENFRLRGLYRSLDTCYGQRGDCSTTGRDVGVNFDQLGAAQGTTTNVRLRAGGRQLNIVASDYQAGYCAAEASSDGFATVTRAELFGNGRARTFWFNNLTPNTNYQYRARCSGGNIARGQVSTRPLGPNRRFQLRLKPPAWLSASSAIKAIIYTGTSQASLTPTDELLCTTGCDFRMAISDGSLLYYKVEYRYESGVTVASGPVRAWAP